MEEVVCIVWSETHKKWVGPRGVKPRKKKAIKTKGGKKSRNRMSKVKQLLKRDGHDCSICGVTLKDSSMGTVTLDHIIPKSKGGTNHVHNLRLTHLVCNMNRGNADA